MLEDLFVLEYSLRVLFRNNLLLSLLLLISLWGAASPSAAESTSLSDTSYRLARSPHLGSRFRFLTRESCLRPLVF